MYSTNLIKLFPGRDGLSKYRKADLIVVRVKCSQTCQQCFNLRVAKNRHVDPPRCEKCKNPIQEYRESEEPTALVTCE